MLTINQKAPGFELPDQRGNLHNLRQYAGKWVVLYFYPKDNTPGCTIEACSFRDSVKELTDKNIAVFGVSKDTIKSHGKFADKYKLPFPLLSDKESSMIKKYGAWGVKKFLGKEYEGVKRISYIIDPHGQIAKVYEKVNPLIHAKEILSDIDRMSSVDYER